MEDKSTSGIALEEIDTHKLVEDIKKASSQAKNEEDLKMAVEKLIDPKSKFQN